MQLKMATAYRHGTRAGKRAATKDRPFWGPAFAGPHALGLLVFMAFPLGLTVVMGFFEWPMLAEGDKEFVGFGNYAELLGDPIYRTAMLNTAMFVVAYMIGNLIVSLGLAAWIGPKMRFRQFFRVLFFIPVVTPAVANAVVWRMIYQDRGILPSLLESWGIDSPSFLNDPNWALAAIVMMSVWQGFGYNMLIFSAALDAVPESITEAAMLDGAGQWRTFWRIKFPMITPSVFYATTMTLITSFQVFTQPYIMTKGGPGSATLTVVQYLYKEGFSYQNLGMAAAAGSILFVVILMITAVQFVGEKRWVNYD
jgi:multiple sugar transport system permease protein